MLVETFLRRQLGLKAHTVTRVEETERYMVVHIPLEDGRPGTPCHAFVVAVVGDGLEIGSSPKRVIEVEGV